MRCILIAAAAIVWTTAAGTTAFAQATVTGAPKGTAPVTTEGYGPSSVVVCNEAGYCSHAEQAYDYPPGAQIYVQPHDWVWNNGENYAWREHTGRGYWRGDNWGKSSERGTAQLLNLSLSRGGGGSAACSRGA